MISYKRDLLFLFACFLFFFKVMGKSLHFANNIVCFVVFLIAVFNHFSVCD